MAEKFETEKSIENFCYCLNVLSECRLLRDSKHLINLVYDGVTDEIKLVSNLLKIIQNYRDAKNEFFLGNRGVGKYQEIFNG